MNDILIRIQTKPHSEQRYDTAGDWLASPTEITITVSEMPDKRYERLVAIHEVVEALLCRWLRISQEAVDAWDRASTADEPGDDPRAPYHECHVVAGVVERLAAKLLGVDWNDYSREIAEL